MFLTYWHRLLHSLANLIGVWYITNEMSPQDVVDEAIKKWGKASVALTYLLQTASPDINIVYAKCILWDRCRLISLDDLSSPQILRKLLDDLPEKQRPDAFMLAVHNDKELAASLFCQFSHNVIPGLTSLVKDITIQWETEPRHDDLALHFYQSLSAYGAPRDEAQWLFVRALVARGFYAHAEPFLLDLVHIRTSPDWVWMLITVLQALQRPQQQLLDVIRHFIDQTSPSDRRVYQAWNLIKDLYEGMLSKGTVEERFSYLRTIYWLLERLPEIQRSSALTLVAGENDVRTVSILTSFTGQPLVGFENLVDALGDKWSNEPRSDDLALRLYQLLPAYGVPQVKADWLQARAFVARREYDQAELLLQRLADAQPSPDGLLLLAAVYHALRRSPQLLLETLQKFIYIAYDDTRLGQAWKTIGDLYGEQLNDGVASVQAYQHAEIYGVQVPQLLAYRNGNWDAIPALHVHPDYAYPVMTVIDLEVDPHPTAKPGERIFEVAGVRIKGKTTLQEYQSFIRRPFRPAKMKTTSELEQAPEPGQVATSLRLFIGESLLVGHNFRAFDAKQLRGMGVSIQEERIVDTLTFARLLYPDSLHHNLALLCRTHHVEVAEGTLHTALADAKACARLFHALCDELVQRGGMLLTGIRALVPPRSAFDQVVLQPRNLAANPHLSWSLDATPSKVHVLAFSQGLPASEKMRTAFQRNEDILVELHDPEGAYITQLPTNRRSLVTVSSYTRLEYMLSTYQHKDALYVLPNPRTVLCPHRIRILIENAVDSDSKLLLFCLYQASHNKDASTLYPMRLHSVEPDLLELKKNLMQACCSADVDLEHSAACPAIQAHLNACATHSILLTTHETLSHQDSPPQADLIVIDDIAELQMHLAEYIAEHISSDQLQSSTSTPNERNAFELLSTEVQKWAGSYITQPGYHERLPLRNLSHLFIHKDNQTTTHLLTTLQDAGTKSSKVAEQLQRLCTDATRDTKHPEDLHAYWVDVWFSDDSEKANVVRWAIYGLSANLPKVFMNTFWGAYKQHIVCGTAISTGGNIATFLERSLGLPEKLPFLRDMRPKSRVFVPNADVIAPSGFLRRSSWAMEVGAYLYSLQAQDTTRTMLVTLNNSSVTKALTNAFQQVKSHLSRQLLATSLGWTTTKIAERIADPQRQVLAIVTPRTRYSYVHTPVDIEVTGPLRFLYQQDPLVAAHMRVFAHLYKAEGPFNAYALPQALLELKSRLSSNAELHVILDSRLHTQVYRDEAFAMLEDIAIVEPQQKRPDISQKMHKAQSSFLSSLSQALKEQGIDVHDSKSISDAELNQALRIFWDTDTFKKFKVDDNNHVPVTQKEIVCGVLEGKDQLLVAATGGGKSLCYQLPAILQAGEFPPKVTLVFSPLISLMSNQVDDLRRKGIFSAIVLNSTLSAVQRQEHLRGLQRGEYSIVYIAPEQIRSASLRSALSKREIGLIAVDEAHCLSQWGHDFRTDYFAVKDWIARISGAGRRTFPILALTATARKGYEDVQNQDRSDQTSTIKDIIEKLDLKKIKEAIITSPERQELEFHVEQIASPLRACLCGRTFEVKEGNVKCQQCGKMQHMMLTEVQEAVEKIKLNRIIELLNDTSDAGLRNRWDIQFGKRQKGLIYCAYRKTTTLVAVALQKRFHDLRIGTYSAELDITEREDVLQRFTHDDESGLDIVVATNAFGMGIDIRKLGFVIHFDTPGSLEAYYQEAGRAGRDKFFMDEGQHARCILLYHPSDMNKQRFLSRKNSITQYQIEAVYDAICEPRHDVGAKLENPLEESPIKHEVIYTEQEIATRAGINADNVAMALHYLEYHANFNGEKILERGDTANRVLRLKFVEDYKKKCALLPETSPSQPLLELFRKSDNYQLKKGTTTPISLKELSSSNELRWSVSQLEQEICNLKKRDIITYDCDGRIKWTHDAEYARKIVNGLKQNITTLIDQIESTSSKRRKSGTQTFSTGETVYENMSENITKYHLSAVAPHLFLRFLSALSHSDGRDNTFRLFKKFVRNARYGQPGKFELRLWTEDNCNPLKRLHTIFAAFQETISLLERVRVSDQEQIFDLLAIEPNTHRRQLLNHQLLLLDMLGVLTYKSDPSLGLALRITFKQSYVPREQLTIDLSSLRLKETYEKHKLKLMEHYVTTDNLETTRAQKLKAYFYGENPLVELIEQPLRTDLTQEQQMLITLEKGCHLIEGPAGCGKTTTLVEFIKHLVYQNQVPIDRIMVTAHYHSAVNRIAKQLEALQENESAALSTTINSFGEKIFRKYRTRLVRGDGKPYYENEPEVKDSLSTAIRDKVLISKTLASIYNGTWQHEPWPQDLSLPKVIGVYQPNDGVEKQCLEDIRRLCEQGIFPTSTVTKEQLEALFGKRKEATNILSFRYAVYMVFLQLRGQENYYSFEDQILFGLTILQKNPSIVREYQLQYEYVIVDELQDFTPAQIALFRILCTNQRNILAFGDRDQEIRPKKIESLGVFALLNSLDSCHHSHHLTVNFRSTQQILDLISNVRDFHSGEKRPPLRSFNDKSGELPVVLSVHSIDKPTEGMIKSTTLLMMVQAALDCMEQLPEQDKRSVALIVAKSDWCNQVINHLRKKKYDFSVLERKSHYQLHHVDRILVYLRLISNKQLDPDTEKLLRYCLVPHFDEQQIKQLKNLAKRKNRTIFSLLRHEKVFTYLQLTNEQKATLQAHLDVINTFNIDNSAKKVFDMVSQIENGPFAVVSEHEQKTDDIISAIKDFDDMTVAEALAYVNQNLSFLEHEQKPTGLIVTTIDHAKSEEFDTVFYVGADFILTPNFPKAIISYKRRFYVTISRARERLFLVVDGENWRNNQLLASIPHNLYREEVWSSEKGLSGIVPA